MATAAILAAAAIPAKTKLTRPRLVKLNDHGIWLPYEWSPPPPLIFWVLTVWSSPFRPLPTGRLRPPKEPTNENLLSAEACLDVSVLADAGAGGGGRRTIPRSMDARPPGMRTGKRAVPSGGISRTLSGSKSAQDREWWQPWWPWGGRVVSFCVSEFLLADLSSPLASSKG